MSPFNAGIAGLLIAILVVAAAEGGCYLARDREQNPRADAAFGVVQGAAYALVALLLGFSFSLALARYDARRASLLREANSIGTTILRTDLLDAQTASEMRDLLREYVAARIDFSAGGTDAAQRSKAQGRSDSLQKRMWTLTIASARRDLHSTTIPLFVQTLNSTIDSSGEEAAVLSATIPPSVIWVLVALVLTAVAMMGYGFGRAGRRRPSVSLLLALMFSLTIATIIDLDRPQHGLIRVSLAPLEGDRNLLESYR